LARYRPEEEIIVTAKELKSWREKRSLSIAAAASMFGYTESHWRALERGTTPIRKALEMAIEGVF
jgi:hypothetical protein